MTQDALRKALSERAALTADALERLCALFAARGYEPSATIAGPGEPLADVFWIERGLVRVYTLGEDGAEWNKAFFDAGDFAGPFPAALEGLASDYGVETLEPTTIWTAPYAAFCALCDRDAACARLARRLLEDLLTMKERRARSLQQQGAADRYADFVSAFPTLTGRVPQFHLASFLGMSEVTLSRVKTAAAKAASRAAS